MDKPIEQMTLDDLKARLDLLDRAQMIEETVARELVQILKELIRRAEQAALPGDQPDCKG
jgi:hypothetical protein